MNTEREIKIGVSLFNLPKGIIFLSLIFYERFHSMFCLLMKNIHEENVILYDILTTY